MTAGYRSEVLQKHHDRRTFDCGVESLTRYLQERAMQDMRNSVAVCYVSCALSDNVVHGYATLSATTIEGTGLPSELVRKLPRYPLLPAALIGRLAVDRSVQGQGIGSFLLLDMLRRSVELQSQIGLMAVVVDAQDEPAALFYQRYGFRTLIDQPRRLFLTLATVREIVV